MNRIENSALKRLALAGVVCAGIAGAFSPALRVVAQPPDANDPSDGTEAAQVGTRAISTITGEGTAGNIAKFTGPNAIGDSVIIQNAGKIGIGTAAPSAPLTVQTAAAGGTAIDGISASGSAVHGTSTDSIGVHGTHSATTGARPGVQGSTFSTASNAVGVQGTILPDSPGGFSAGVRGTNNGTGSLGIGVYGSHAGAGWGVYGTAPSGRGVYGSTTSGTGVYGFSSSGIGVSAFSTSNYGVNGSSSSSTGVHGVHTSASGASPGIKGETNSTSGTAVAVQGVVNSSSSAGGFGVQGLNYGTGAVGYGVHGAHSGSGNGVYGFCSAGTGVRGNSSSGYGVYGGSGTGYAGYFSGKARVTGNLSVGGTLTKGAGSFKIDHPLDPAKKYLSHSFVESPDMMNIYNGNATTDAKGFAIVTLPDYFTALNRDYRYQLTCIGTFAQAIVSSEIKDNRFTIRTDKPNVKVSWMVTGIRHDAYAKAHRIEVVQNKTGKERGAYLHPELFGQPKTRSIEYALRSETRNAEAAGALWAGRKSE